MMKPTTISLVRVALQKHTGVSTSACSARPIRSAAGHGLQWQDKRAFANAAAAPYGCSSLSSTGEHVFHNRVASSAYDKNGDPFLMSCSSRRDDDDDDDEERNEGPLELLSRANDCQHDGQQQQQQQRVPSSVPRTLVLPRAASTTLSPSSCNVSSGSNMRMMVQQLAFAQRDFDCGGRTSQRRLYHTTAPVDSSGAALVLGLGAISAASFAAAQGVKAYQEYKQSQPEEEPPSATFEQEQQQQQQQQDSTSNSQPDKESGDAPRENVFKKWFDAGVGSKYYEGGFEDGMTRREAALILGVRESSTAKRIKEAHRKLLILNHPDTGGSTYVAGKINEAKELLLKGRRDV